MAQKAVADLSEDFLKCSICLSQYKQPVLLPCVHSFCTCCLEQYERCLQNQPFSCPTCRRVVHLTVNGVKDLPKNFFLDNLLERLEMVNKVSRQSLKNCKFCRKRSSCFFCIDCRIHLCKYCKGTHSDLPALSDHTVIAKEKLSDANYLQGISSSRAPFCDKHSQEKLRFYCVTCSQLVCRDCTILSHQGHECIEAEKRIAIARENLEMLLKKSGPYFRDGLNYTKVIEKVDKELKGKSSSLCSQVDSCFDKIVSKLQCDRENLHKEIKKIIGRKRTLLEQKELETTNWMKAMENTREVTRQMLEGGNPWGMLGMEKDLQNSFEVLQQDPLERKYGISALTKGIGNLQFSPTASPMQRKGENPIGRIYFKESHSFLQRDYEETDDNVKPKILRYENDLPQQPL
ncbi:E3 ubiquitin-protein ligase TRIM56 [Holothuria leucospilota]|uniref:E3 ubiquitin-protein ligase TRIM56 n=1 Tax=Holothuria leucospilota TaxID=206669 RepID=A0A9Q1BIJ7_HOLLE|nr:E3 ubiquitin-protein ligase TRIM56 [Holothuria leucospilota]